ncbi:hypothetical protein PENSPDRAFT_658619 [Peniophora sp. CONT]|nr:hypothetical protein PENSPDRAFT_658619 [Peniophora sp. CONT]
MLHKHIDDLSPEILATVFKIVDAQCEPKLARRAPPHEIITLSHVSNRWRDISTRLQSLWGSALPCSSLQWTKLCLERCQTAPFNFSFASDMFDATEEYHDAACLVFPHISRAKRLQIIALPNRGFADARSEDSKLSEFFAGMQTCVSENIVEIQVHISEDEPYSVSSDLSLLFGPAAFPRLQRMFFWNVIHPFNSSCHLFSHSLLTLQLDDSCVWQSIDEMIELLRSVPLLESLAHGASIDMDLSHFFDPIQPRMYPPQCVPLKNLKYLKCWGQGLFMQNIMLFSYLDVPPNTDVFLEGRRRATGDNGDLSQDSTKGLVEMAKTCLQKHFQSAIASGSFFPVLRIQHELFHTMFPPVQADGSSPATDVLPPHLSVGVPYMGVQSDDGLELGLSDRLLDIYTSLPCLTRATVLVFDEDVTQCTTGLLKPFTRVRRLIFNDIVPAIALTTFCDTHDERFFPHLEDVELSCIAARGVIAIDAYLKVAEVLARCWGNTLQSVELEHTYFVERDDLVVDGFKERIGERRVSVVVDSEEDWEGPASEDEVSGIEDDNG